MNNSKFDQANVIELSTQELTDASGGFLPLLVMAGCWGVMIGCSAVALGFKQALNDSKAKGW